MARITLEQIKVLKELTGIDYGFNGVQLKHPRTLHASYLAGIYSIKDILLREKDFRERSTSQYTTKDEYEFYNEVEKCVRSEMKKREVPGKLHRWSNNVRDFRKSVLEETTKEIK